MVVPVFAGKNTYQKVDLMVVAVAMVVALF
ncbi:uncharacterized protein METZ01_LOCUS115216 [marine metagenome]|uniref:Uncharacterized protein n=1 Tax=marine metagenome TaxID=408172 RepID=A0A381XCS7_9ZZZZ